jgi:hypothetical protein
MALSTFHNSPTTSSQEQAWVETGTVANVNVRNLTIDWVSQYSGKMIPDLQIMAPYVHYNNGEGITCVPEVGAICVVCFPSDEDSPFVLGFLAAPELEGAEFGKDITKALDDPGVETEEDVRKTNSISSGGSTTTEGNQSDASFRAGRPVLNPGDIYLQGRDENFIVLKRGGVLQLGSTQICQRAYVPINNIIRDFSENYELNTAAGTLEWGVERVENNPAGNAPSKFQLVAREYAQDAKASIKLLIGALEDEEKPPNGDTSFVELTIAPQNINPDDGSLSGKPVYVLRLDKAGNSYIFQKATRTEEIEGDHSLLVKGKQDVTVTGDQTMTLGARQTINITGEQEISGKAGSKENWTGTKSITAAAIKMGSEGASEPAVLGLKLISWLASHTHPAPNTPPVQAAQVSQLVSKKVFVE